MSAPSPVPCPGRAPLHAGAGAFSRRSLLAAVGIAPVVLTVGGLTGCTTGAAPGPDAITPDQVDRLAGQVEVQQRLVDAYAAAFTVSPELAASAAGLADQARAQLTRLQAAAPSAGTDSTATSSSPAPTGPAGAGDPAGARAALHSQVDSAATSHAAACLDFTGARAALLGSIAAGLRGQQGLLA